MRISDWSSYVCSSDLLPVPQSRDFASLNKSERGLIPVKCEVVRGIVFINLDMDAEPLASFLAPTDRELGDFPLENREVKNIFVVDMACNWKTALDNFLEIYHVSSVHANSIAPYLQYKSFSVSLYEGGHARFATDRKSTRLNSS